MRSQINSYRDLVVWQEAMSLTVESYKFASKLPKEELYGLMSQVRRSAVSVPANIAEGYGRDNRGSYVQQLRVAQGSLKELETHLLISERVGLAQPEVIAPLLIQAEKVGRHAGRVTRTGRRRFPPCLWRPAD